MNQPDFDSPDAARARLAFTGGGLLFVEHKLCLVMVVEKLQLIPAQRVHQLLDGTYLHSHGSGLGSGRRREHLAFFDEQDVVGSQTKLCIFLLFFNSSQIVFR